MISPAHAAIPASPITAIRITETGEPGKGARSEIRVPEGAFRFTNCRDTGKLMEHAGRINEVAGYTRFGITVPKEGSGLSEGNTVTDTSAPACTSGP